MNLGDEETRRQRRLRRLGSNKPICGTCGENDDRCLELHHIADHGRDETTVTICRNCHRKVSDKQKDYPAFDKSADPALDKIGHCLLGIAELLTLIIEKLFELGHMLIGMAVPQIADGDNS